MRAHFFKDTVKQFEKSNLDVTFYFDYVCNLKVTYRGVIIMKFGLQRWYSNGFGRSPMTANTLGWIRIAVFGFAGLVCASYSVLVLLTGTPNPISPWLPGVSGVAAAIIIWLSAIVAGRREASIAHDELYKLEWGFAIRLSYWFAIVLYPLFGVLMALGLVSSESAFAAMGTATGAAPLLSFCIINLRG